MAEPPRFSDDADSDEWAGQAPLSAPPPLVQARPFYRRCPLSVGFVVVLIVIYAAVSFPRHFLQPMDWVLQWGGFYPPAVQAGQWWRFVSATLLHASPGHLLSNAFGLLIFGNLLEPVVGSWRLLGLYGLSGWLGLMFSGWFLPQVFTIGASAIDFGLIGAYFGLMLWMHLRTNRALFWQELRSLLFFVFLFMMWTGLDAVRLNSWAHLGGFLAGLGLAMLWSGPAQRQ